MNTQRRAWFASCIHKMRKIRERQDAGKSGVSAGFVGGRRTMGRASEEYIADLLNVAAAKLTPGDFLVFKLRHVQGADVELIALAIAQRLGVAGDAGRVLEIRVNVSRDLERIAGVLGEAWEASGLLPLDYFGGPARLVRVAPRAAGRALVPPMAA